MPKKLHDDPPLGASRNPEEKPGATDSYVFLHFRRRVVTGIAVYTAWKAPTARNNRFIPASTFTAFAE